MLSPLQKNISSKIYNIVPQFPKVVADLISEYVDYEIISRALGPLVIAYNEAPLPIGLFYIEDAEVSKAIKHCLTSRECAAEIKLKILRKFYPGYRGNRTVPYRTIQISNWNDDELVTAHSTVTISPKLLVFQDLTSQISLESSRIFLDNVDFRRQGFKSLNLCGASAVGAKFQHCRLQSANFSGVDCTFADFTSAFLSGANFAFAMAARANLSGAFLRNTNFEGANLSGADLMEAIIDKADLTGANLTRAILTKADLRRADLTGANLTRANLTGADLMEANLTGANLTRANLTGANLAGARLTRANLTGSNLTGANLTRANLTGLNLTGANLTRANLTEANLTGAILEKCIQKDTIFEGANMTGVKRDWCLIL